MLVGGCVFNRVQDLIMAGDEHYYMICLICLFVIDFILKENTNDNIRCNCRLCCS